MSAWRGWRRSCGILGETHAGELPARRGREEVAVARAQVRLRTRAAAAAQHALAAHELAVVFAERAGPRPIAGIRQVRAARPFPDIAEQLAHAGARASAR